MTPPFSTPSKASYFFSGFHSATTSPFFGKLRICSPSGFHGPQPQHALFGAYFSWSDLSFIVEISQAAQPRFFCQRVPPAKVDRLLRGRCQAQSPKAQYFSALRLNLSVYPPRADESGYGANSCPPQR